MEKVTGKASFFRRKYFFLAGAFWLLMGVPMVILGINAYIAYPYTIFGLLYAAYGFMKKDLPREFIRWDDEKIEISEWQQNIKTYHWKDVASINVSETNLTIKSGVANGTMVALDNYSQADIEKLKTQLISFKSLAVA